MPLLLLSLLTGAGPAGLRVEVSFELPRVQHNPFDFTANDVQATFLAPDGRERHVRRSSTAGRPGGHGCRRTRTGSWRLAKVTLNGAAQPVAAEPLQVTALPTTASSGWRPTAAGSSSTTHALLSLGCNVGWGNRDHDVPYYLAKQGAAGTNWSRIWMTHFDSRNLEWTYDDQQPLGQLSLKAAERWDAIVSAAEAQGIRLQIVLQHHGQYSTRTNPNWSQNPFNQANGGFLATPQEFFTHPRAIALTKAKYRYVIARWGYSPAVMAWELFNEVQYTDTTTGEGKDAVGQWHREMAAFLRAQDPDHHLVTTSSDLDLPIWSAMDYYQPHTYPSDPVTAIAAQAPATYDQPIFFGEIGPGGALDRDDGRYLHRILWAGLMGEQPGAAQYWTWDQVDRADLYQHFRGASRFVNEAGLAGRRMTRTKTTVETPALGPLVFGPAGGWGKPGLGTLVIGRNGVVDGLEDLPGFLHGQYHKDLPTVWTAEVDYPATGTFSIALNQIARAGAVLVLSVDGQEKLRREFPATEKDTASQDVLTVDVPAGQHTVTVANEGQDWVVVRNLTLTPYAAALALLGKQDADLLVAWLYRGDVNDAGETAIPGTLTAPGMAAGTWQVTFYDCLSGAATGQREVTVAGDGRLVVELPPVGRDRAVVARRR